MSRKEAYDAIIHRIYLPENSDLRNPTIFSDSDNKIAEYVKDLEIWLSKLSNENSCGKKIAEAEFDKTIKALCNLLNELGWAN